MEPKSFCRLTAIILALASASKGAPLQGNSLRSLCSMADVIAVGEASFRDQAYSFSFTPERFIKGSLPVASVVELACATEPPEKCTAPADHRSTLVVFLKKSADTWTFVPVNFGNIGIDLAFLPALPSGDPHLPAANPTASCEDAVVSEVALAIDSSNFDRYGFTLQSFAPYASFSGTSDALYALRNSADPNAAAIGAASLLILGDAATMKWLSKFPFETLPENSLFDLANGIEAYSNPDVEGINNLGAISSRTSFPLRIRRSAAFALRSIHSRSCLPFLAALMADQDREIRFHGAFGLGSFANNFPVFQISDVPSMAYMRPVNGGGPYTTKETLSNMPGLPTRPLDEVINLNYWRHWWQENEAALQK